MVSPYPSPSACSIMGHFMNSPSREKRMGRPPAKNGPLVDRPIGIAKEVNRFLENLANAEDVSVPELVRRAIDEKYINPQPVVVNDVDSVGAPLLDFRVACGAPTEAGQEASVYVLSERVADEIVFNEGTDFLIRSRGQSMRGRGILDEFVVSMSPLKIGAQPRRGKVALVAFTDEEGNVTGTLKTWDGEEDGRPRLLDGNEEVFPIPEGTVKAQAIAIATGVIGEL